MPAKLTTLIAWALLRFDPVPSMQILRRWCRDGRIPGAVRIGREWRVPADAEYRAVQHQSDIMRFISAHHAQPRMSEILVKNQRCKPIFRALEKASKRAVAAYINQCVTVGFRTAVYQPVIREDENGI